MSGFGMPRKSVQSYEQKWLRGQCLRILSLVFPQEVPKVNERLFEGWKGYLTTQAACALGHDSNSLCYVN